MHVFSLQFYMYIDKIYRGKFWQKTTAIFMLFTKHFGFIKTYLSTYILIFTSESFIKKTVIHIIKESKCTEDHSKYPAARMQNFNRI